MIYCLGLSGAANDTNPANRRYAAKLPLAGSTRFSRSVRHQANDPSDRATFPNGSEAIKAHTTRYINSAVPHQTLKKAYQECENKIKERKERMESNRNLIERPKTFLHQPDCTKMLQSRNQNYPRETYQIGRYLEQELISQRPRRGATLLPIKSVESCPEENSQGMENETRGSNELNEIKTHQDTQYVQGHPDVSHSTNAMRTRARLNPQNPNTDATDHRVKNEDRHPVEGLQRKGGDALSYDKTKDTHSLKGATLHRLGAAKNDNSIVEDLRKMGEKYHLHKESKDTGITHPEARCVQGSKTQVHLKAHFSADHANKVHQSSPHDTSTSSQQNSFVDKNNPERESKTQMPFVSSAREDEKVTKTPSSEEVRDTRNFQRNIFTSEQFPRQLYSSKPRKIYFKILRSQASSKGSSIFTISNTTITQPLQSVSSLENAQNGTQPLVQASLPCDQIRQAPDDSFLSSTNINSPHKTVWKSKRNDKKQKQITCHSTFPLSSRCNTSSRLGTNPKFLENSKKFVKSKKYKSALSGIQKGPSPRKSTNDASVTNRKPIEPFASALLKGFNRRVEVKPDDSISYASPHNYSTTKLMNISSGSLQVHQDGDDQEARQISNESLFSTTSQNQFVVKLMDKSTEPLKSCQKKNMQHKKEEPASDIYLTGDQFVEPSGPIQSQKDGKELKQKSKESFRTSSQCHSIHNPIKNLPIQAPQQKKVQQKVSSIPSIQLDIKKECSNLGSIVVKPTNLSKSAQTSLNMLNYKFIKHSLSNTISQSRSSLKPVIYSTEQESTCYISPKKSSDALKSASKTSIIGGQMTHSNESTQTSEKENTRYKKFMANSFIHLKDHFPENSMDDVLMNWQINRLVEYPGLTQIMEKPDIKQAKQTINNSMSYTSPQIDQKLMVSESVQTSRKESVLYNKYNSSTLNHLNEKLTVGIDEAIGHSDNSSASNTNGVVSVQVQTSEIGSANGHPASHPHQTPSKTFASTFFSPSIAARGSIPSITGDQLSKHFETKTTSVEMFPQQLNKNKMYSGSAYVSNDYLPKQVSTGVGPDCKCSQSSLRLEMQSIFVDSFELNSNGSAGSRNNLTVAAGRMDKSLQTSTAPIRVTSNYHDSEKPRRRLKITPVEILQRIPLGPVCSSHRTQIHKPVFKIAPSRTSVDYTGSSFLTGQNKHRQKLFPSEQKPPKVTPKIQHVDAHVVVQTQHVQKKDKETSSSDLFLKKSDIKECGNPNFCSERVKLAGSKSVDIERFLMSLLSDSKSEPLVITTLKRFEKFIDNLKSFIKSGRSNDRYKNDNLLFILNT